MNFLEMARRLADRLDETRPSTIYSADLANLSQTLRRYREHLNLAYTMVKLSLGRSDESQQSMATITTAGASESYDLPAGLLNIDQVQVAEDPPMALLPWPEYEALKRNSVNYGDNLATGLPAVCAIYQRKLWLYPVPDAAMTVSLRGRETLTELDLDADEPDLPADFHRVIPELALHLEMVYEGNPQAGGLSVSEHGTLLAQGGQAAVAVNLLNLVRRNSGDHVSVPPRIRGL